METLRENLARRQAVGAGLFLSVFIALGFNPFGIFASRAVQFSTIAGFCIAAAAVWWWAAASEPGGLPDERIRANTAASSLSVLYVFFVGTLGIVGWRIAHGSFDASMLSWIVACTVLWVLEIMRRMVRS